MAKYLIEGYQGKKTNQSSFKVMVEADEKIVGNYTSSNDKQKHFEAVVKCTHFPLAEVVRVTYFNKK